MRTTQQLQIICWGLRKLSLGQVTYVYVVAAETYKNLVWLGIKDAAYTMVTHIQPRVTIGIAVITILLYPPEILPELPSHKLF